MTKVILLSGFLGSGKTTYLNELIKKHTHKKLKTVVIMNESAEFSVDSLIINQDVPVVELADGCICCSLNGDLTMELFNLVHEQKPDVIIIESTGLANPFESVDAITEASLLTSLILEDIITIVNAPEYLNQIDTSSAKAKRLIENQIKCANSVIINKKDLISKTALEPIVKSVFGLNSKAQIWLKEKGYEMERLLVSDRQIESRLINRNNFEIKVSKLASSDHDNVITYTHYIFGNIYRSRFEQLIKSLPKDVVRAKGVLRFVDDDGTYLFQLAYQKFEIFPIRPRVKVPNVAVFIGQNFSKHDIQLLFDEFKVEFISKEN